MIATENKTVSPSGLTPPTTPPHKPVEEELFKPADGTKVGVVTGASGGDGGGGVVQPAAPKPSAWLSRTHHQRKLPEQTELYAQLRRMGHDGDGGRRSFGDHDYCVLSLGERRKRSTAMLGAFLQASSRAATPPAAAAAAGESGVERLPLPEAVEQLQMSAEGVDCQSLAATPPSSEEEEAAERSSVSRSPSPVLHLCPDSPASKADSR